MNVDRTRAIEISTFIALAMIATSTAMAGPIADTFGDGAFGLKWGAAKSEVQAAFPVGEWRTLPQSKLEIYTVTDDRAILGVQRRPDDKFIFGFDFTGRLTNIEIEMPETDNESVVTNAHQAFGKAEVISLANYVVSRWEDGGLRLQIRQKVGIGTASELWVSLISTPTPTKDALGFQ